MTRRTKKSKRLKYVLLITYLNHRLIDLTDFSTGASHETGMVFLGVASSQRSSDKSEYASLICSLVGLQDLDFTVHSLFTRKR